MADLVIRPFTLFAVSLIEVEISGSITSNSVGVARDVIVYKNGDFSSILTYTSSASDGTYSITVNGTHNDYFTVIHRGLESLGEFSKIYDYLRPEA